MLQVYWACLLGGLLFAVVTLIFGDLLDGVFDGVFEGISLEHLDFLNPMVIVGGITAFGGAGIMLSEYSSMAVSRVIILSVMIAIVLSMVVYFAYVKPMKNAENSTTFSVQELVGNVAEVTIPVPKNGYGEVLLKIGAGNTNQIAASMDKEDIVAGTRVIVGEVINDVLYVFPYAED